jgi:Zinc carboxypeptidase/Amidohydrolase family
MEASSWAIVVALSSLLLAALGSPPASDLYNVDVRQLSELWDRERISPADPYTLKPEQLQQRLQALAAEHKDVLQLQTVGKSVEGRDIALVRLGSGTPNILLWSQMHGDEPTATSSLLDLFQFLARHRAQPWVADILARYTLLCIPMLNPDGAERNQRRNAQGIDINRDARLLETPEGRLLKEIRDRFNPILGFNLHNQNSLTTVGDTGLVATIALLAVAADAAETGRAAGETGAEPGVLAKQVTAVLYEALSPFAYGHISRYDETYNPRAFGDNLTLWGTPVVLIESGGLPAGKPADFAVMLNFVGILATLDSLASGKVQNANPAVFDSLKMNSDSPIFDLLLRNAWILTGTGIPPFRGDIAIRGDLRSGARGEAIIADLGDLGVYSAHQTIDCAGALVTPGLITWDPERNLLAEEPASTDYLRRGIVTVLESLPANELTLRSAAGELQSADRGMNWGFVITGNSGAGADWDLLLAEWLAAGARGWIPGTGSADPARSAKVPRWFGIEMLQKNEAERYRVPTRLEGNPASVLPRWTSEAARRFRMPRRGTIAIGSVADLVLWSGGSAAAPPTDLRQCKPTRVIVNGEVLDAAHPTPARRGRFIGR